MSADEVGVGKRRDGFVGAQSFGFILMASSFVVFGGWVLTHDDEVSSLSDRLGASIVVVGVSAFMLMAGSARIFVRDADVHVVSFLFTFVVPVEEIVALQAANGFGIQVVSGRVITSMAFGSSLIAEFTGNRRSRRAARRLTELCGPFTAVLASDPVLVLDTEQEAPMPQGPRSDSECCPSRAALSRRRPPRQSSKTRSSIANVGARRLRPHPNAGHISDDPTSDHQHDRATDSRHVSALA